MCSWQLVSGPGGERRVAITRAGSLRALGDADLNAWTKFSYGHERRARWRRDGLLSRAA